MKVTSHTFILGRLLRGLASLGWSASLVVGLGCDATQTVPGAEVPESKLGGSIKGSFLVSGVNPVAVAPGELAAVEGSGLTEDTVVLVNDQPVPIVEREGDRKLVFKMPAGNPGMEVVAVRKNWEQSTHLMLRLSADGHPVVVGGDLSQLCKGETFFSLSGDAIEGQRDCSGKPVVCSEEGQTDCMASGDFPVADKQTLAARVVEGANVAGVDGVASAASGLLECQKDGAILCIATAEFPALDTQLLLPGAIASGVTIAGVAGSLVVPTSGDVRQGVRYGGDLSLAGSLEPGGAAPPACTVEGGVDCVVGTGFAAAAMMGLADKVLSTASVAGVPGNVTLPPPGEVRAGVAFGVRGAGAIGVLTLPDAGDVYAGVRYGVDGDAATGSLTLASAANVRTSQGAFGRGGASVTPTLGDCASDGEESCVASASYPAADVSGLAAKVIVGATVAGQGGSVHVPAANTVLAGVNVGPSSVGTVFLPDANDVRVAVGFGAGSVLIGTLDPGVVPAGCSSDGETNCVAGASFPAADVTNLASKVLDTASVGGVAGNVTLPPPGKVLSATAYGVGGNALSGTLTLPAASDVHSSAAAYGEPAALLMPSYSPDFPDAIHVLTGDTVDGVAGTLTLPPASQVLSSVGPFGVGGSGSTPSLTLPQAGKVLASTQYGEGGNGATGSLTLPAAGDVLTGSGSYGDPGAALTPSYNPDFPSVANVLAGETVNGIGGMLTLPDVGKVLASTQYGVAGSGSTGSLTLPAPSAVRVGSGSYGDPGAPVTPAYSPDFPSIASVHSSDTVDGVAGTLTLPPAADVYLGVSYGAGGNGATGTLTLAAAANVSVSQGTFGRGGSSVVPSLGSCAADGALGCVANAAYPAADVSGLSAKVIVGATVAGQSGAVHLPAASAVLTGVSVGTSGSGNVVLPATGDVRLAVAYGAASALTGALDPGAGLPASCTADGQTNCVAVTSFPAADVAGLGSKVLSTATVAGVAGNVTLPPASKVLSAWAYGIGGGGLIGSLTLPAAGDVRSGSASYGEPGALLTPSYSPDFPAAGNVLSGHTVNGVAGTLTLPVASQVLASAGAYGVSGNGSTPTLSLPAAGKVLASTQYGVAGNGSTGSLTLPAASVVLTGSGSYGDPGAAITPSYNPDFPSVANVLAGDTVNGIAGTLTLPAVGKVLSPTLYGVGGAGSTGTLSLPSVTAVRTGSGTYGDPGAPMTPSYSPDFPSAANVHTSDTVNGVAGTLTLPLAADVYTGIQYGIGGTGSTGALTLATAANVRTLQGTFGRGGTSVTPTLANCSTDGAIDCVTNTSYKSAAMTSATAGNIKSGITIAGVSGSYPSSTYPLPSAGATTDLVSLAGTTTAGSYEWWSSSGARYTGTISDAGTITPTTTNVTYTGTVYRTFTVAGDADLVAANIKSGANIFGVAGGYPSATHPLAGATTTLDLDVDSFNTKITSSSNFEWFDSSGTRYLNAGDTDLMTGNILSGVDIFGTTGSLTLGPTSCTGDGQVSCVTTGSYRSVDTALLTSWDLRSGKVAGGITGSLVFNKNMANTSRYNRTSGTGASAGVDIYDSLEDYNDGGSFPTQNATGWPQATGASWLRDEVSDDGIGGGGAFNGVCDGTEACIYQDRITGLSWAKNDGSSRSWESSITYCEGKSYGSYSDWRLPTQKELLQAYVDGMYSLWSPMNLSASNYYWSASTYSYSTSYAHQVHLWTGAARNEWKSYTDNAVCVRP